MTEVLSITQPEGNTRFASPLRHSSSQTAFLLQNASSYSRSSSSNLKKRYTAAGYETSNLSASVPSSAPSSPQLTAPEFSNQPSYASTPSSSLSLDEHCQTEVEDIAFPLYDDRDYYEEVEDADPSSSPEAAVGDTVAKPASDSALAKPTNPQISNAKPTAGDDTAIENEPTRHVDYLSHNWKEEDIWASWRHIVAKRNAYSNSARLENASWRTWAKTKHQLKTISPETLNWMKDHDVTWLYGPLQTGTAKAFNLDITTPTSLLSRSNSFASKKPILKKRSLSEVMLQRSLSSSTLMKQATDAVRAQQPGKRPLDGLILGDRALSDLGTLSEPETPLTRSTTNTSSTEHSASISTSGVQTPCTKRHIHFNNKVEQCIAINKEVDDRPERYKAVPPDDEEDSSEDEMLVMRPVKSATKAKIRSASSTPRNSFSSDSKTIAMLPSTTLNYRGDSPDPAEQKSKQKDTFMRRSSNLSPSSSQQTLRPSFPSSNFLLDDEDEDADINWQPSASNGKSDSLYARHGSHLDYSDGDADADAGHSGLRRTPSGMFMPYEEDDNVGNAGLLSRVVDTVNTAKDIAHVIWNVGWHR